MAFIRKSQSKDRAKLAALYWQMISRGRETGLEGWSRRRLRVSTSYLWSQDKSRPLAPKHLERRHALDTEADAGVGYLDLARRRRGNLVRHHSMLARERMSYKVVIGQLKGRYSRRMARSVARWPRRSSPPAQGKRRRWAGERNRRHGRRPIPTIRLPKLALRRPPSLC